MQIPPDRAPLSSNSSECARNTAPKCTFCMNAAICCACAINLRAAILVSFWLFERVGYPSSLTVAGAMCCREFWRVLIRFRFCVQSSVHVYYFVYIEIRWDVTTWSSEFLCHVLVFTWLIFKTSRVNFYPSIRCGPLLHWELGARSLSSWLFGAKKNTVKSEKKRDVWYCTWMVVKSDKPSKG